jgi:hypothetical protein
MSKITQSGRNYLSVYYEDQPSVARAIREGILDKKHERALKALSEVLDRLLVHVHSADGIDPCGWNLTPAQIGCVNSR